MDRHRRQFIFRPLSACINPQFLVITPACCKAPFCHSCSRSPSWNS
ncbi:protein YoaL [Pseudescherichia vulneris]